MSLSSIILTVVVLAATLAYFFVPEFHTGVLKAIKVARDDLDKIKADGAAIADRLEAHSVKQTAAAVEHTAIAAAATAKAAAATDVAAIAKASAEVVKDAVSGIRT